MKNINGNKIVVFDLDETLGYFVEFGMFWEALINYNKYINNSNTLSQKQFNHLLLFFISIYCVTFIFIFE